MCFSQPSHPHRHGPGPYLRVSQVVSLNTASGYLTFRIEDQCHSPARKCLTRWYSPDSAKASGTPAGRLLLSTDRQPLGMGVLWPQLLWTVCGVSVGVSSTLGASVSPILLQTTAEPTVREELPNATETTSNTDTGELKPNSRLPVQLQLCCGRASYKHKLP